MKTPEFINNIDWEKLRYQKLNLIECIESLDRDVKSYYDIGSKEVSKTCKIQSESLTGILNLIDSIQDYAIDSMGVSEKEVFNLSKR